MKIRVIPIITTIFFIIIFILFYRGLENSNIYVPKTNINKQIPTFNAKLYNSSQEISSSKIFKDNEYLVIMVCSMQR